MATRLAAYSQPYHSSASQSAQRHALHQPPWAQPPYQGAPPIPQGISVNPQQWNAGVWQYNPAYNHNRNPNHQHVPWIPSQKWMPQSQPSSQASQQAAQHQQQVVNPYKRVPRPPSAEYLANKLSDNPLGLSNMIPAEEYYKQSSPEDVQTPWIWKPKDLDAEDEPRNGLRRQATEPVLNPDRPNTHPETFTAKIDLQPTFSPKIVRTPHHYNSSTPSPSRGSSWNSRGSSDSQLSSQMSQLSLGSSGSSSASSSLSRQSSLPPSFPPTPSPSRGDFSYSAPILAESISDEPDSMLSPLIIASTPKTSMSTLRPSRAHHSHPIIPSSLQPIPELSQPNSNSTSKKSSKDGTHSRQEVQHSNSLPNLPPGPSSINYNQLNNTINYPPPPPLPRMGSRHTTTAFIDPSPTKPSSSASTAAAAASGAPSISSIGPPLQHPALVSISSLTASSSPKTPSPRPILAERSFSRQSSRASSTHASPENVHSSGTLHLTPPQITTGAAANQDRSSSYTPSPTSSITASAAAATVAAISQSISGTPSFSASAPAPALSSSAPNRSPNPLPPPPQITRRPIQLPRQRTPPPNWRSRVRKGFWNRRGDHLTLDGYIVYAPVGDAYPDELRHYPLEDEGYLDHDGMWAAYVVRPELPESLPRFGKPAEAPYDKFVVYEYRP